MCLTCYRSQKAGRETVRGDIERNYLSNLLDQFVVQSFVVLKALCEV